MGAAFIEDSRWHDVTDNRERKRRQDRLNQRARRQRLAQQREAQSTSEYSATTSSSSSSISSCSSPQKFPANCTSYLQLPTVATEDQVITQIPISVYTALFNNGAMMGLTCGCIIPSKSKVCDDSIPESLRPTALQLTTLHQTWIDRFPFPKMRDNMISLNRIFNEEEFLSDLFNMYSFDIKPGRPGWDPSAWIISRQFSQKWGFLFY